MVSNVHFSAVTVQLSGMDDVLQLAVINIALLLDYGR